MTKQNQNYIDFRLKDPFSTHTNVNVAGTFNNWDPKADTLSFDKETKDWSLGLKVDLPVGHKVLYKYVVDENKWICDVSAPLEKDDAGNENNVTFVIVRNQSSTGGKTAQEDKSVTQHAQTPTEEDKQGNITSAQKKTEQQQETEEEVFDHKSFHENELFDASEPSHDETAPTSGEENNQEADIPIDATAVHDTHLATGSKKKDDSSTPKPKGEFGIATLWESIAWFFKYYILSWFYPEH